MFLILWVQVDMAQEFYVDFLSTWKKDTVYLWILKNIFWRYHIKISYQKEKLNKHH